MSGQEVYPSYFPGKGFPLMAAVRLRRRIPISPAVKDQHKNKIIFDLIFDLIQA
jgi:hypothetical protein